MLLFQNPDDKTTYIAVKDPKGGLYRMSLTPGSAPASVFRSAQSLPAQRVRARVDARAAGARCAGASPGRAGARSCSTSSAATPRRLLTTTTHDRGRLSFTVRDGRRGRREIIALVRQHRLPQSAGVVAHYDAPRPQRPGRPGAVRITARRGVLSARWGRATGAASYAVRVVLSDGRHLLFLPKKRRRVVVREITAGTRASVTVRGVSATGRRGPRTRARVAARRRRHSQQ